MGSLSQQQSYIGQTGNLCWPRKESFFTEGAQGGGQTEGGPFVFSLIGDINFEGGLGWDLLLLQGGGGQSVGSKGALHQLGIRV